MAEAYGKLTGEPGICFVTRGPGATNASIGVHTAFQDSTPMILFVGQVGNDFMEREAFRKSTTAACSAPWPSGSPRSTAATASPSSSPAPTPPPPAAGPARWCWRCRLWGTPPSRTCRATARAEPSRRAGPRTPARRAGRRAPSLPAAGAAGGWTARAVQRIAASPRPSSCRSARPGGGWNAPAPSQRRRPGRLGMTDALRAPAAADLILAVGTRLGEPPPKAICCRPARCRRRPDPRAPDPEELGRVYSPGRPSWPAPNSPRPPRR